MNRLFLFLFIIIFSSTGCISPFKKKPKPDPAPKPVVIMVPAVSMEWNKISPTYSDKNQIRALLGSPGFVDKHKTGEDWYYSYARSTDYAVISFPVSGYLVNHVQHVRYPEWK